MVERSSCSLRRSSPSRASIERADQGVIGLMALLFDQRLDGADHLVRGGGGQGQLVGGAGGHEHGGEGAAERRSDPFGHPEQLADDLEGQREGVGGDQVDHCVGPGGGDGVEMFVHQAAHPRFERLHSTHREGTGHQAPEPGVIRRVDGQHVPGVGRTRQPLGHHRSGRARAACMSLDTRGSLSSVFASSWPTTSQASWPSASRTETTGPRRRTCSNSPYGLSRSNSPQARRASSTSSVAR